MPLSPTFVQILKSLCKITDGEALAFFINEVNDLQFGRHPRRLRRHQSAEYHAAQRKLKQKEQHHR